MSVNFNNKESYSNSKFEEQITNHNFEEENEDEFWADTLNIEENKSKDKK